MALGRVRLPFKPYDRSWGNLGLPDMRVADDVVLGELDDLGRSLKKTIKSYVKKIKELPKKIAKSFKAIVKQPQRLLYAFPGVGPIGHILKRNKKLRNKVFKNLKVAAPFLQVAASVLNLIIPGLGFAIALAIQAGVTAIDISAMQKAKKAFKREEEAAEAEAAQANAEADKETMAAFDKGAKYILETYNVSREEFQSLSIEDRTKFLNLVVFDRHQKEIAENLGVSRDQFAGMSVQEQIDVLALVGTSVPNAPPLSVEQQAIVGPVEVVPSQPAPVTVPQIVAPQAAAQVSTTPAADVVLPPQAAAHLAPLSAGDGIPWTTYALVGGVLAAGAVVMFIAKSRKA